MKKWNESNKNVFFNMWKYYNFGYYFYGSAIVVVLLYVVSTSSLIVRCAALYEFLICLSVAASSIERRARSVRIQQIQHNREIKLFNSFKSF